MDTFKQIGSSLPSKASTLAPPPPSPIGKLNDSLIAERVTTLLSHYWTAGDDPAIRRLQIHDWLADLGEFPAAIVADACQRWRRTESKRPTIADLRKLCLEAMPVPKPRVSSGFTCSTPEQVKLYEARREEAYRLATEQRRQRQAAIEP